MAQHIGNGTVDAPLDLFIVGAGMSGIGLAHHVAENFPEWTYEIHEAHDDVGGTWHQFRYPGIRSDSDMATFSYPFRPWPHKGVLGGGADIKEYVRDVARDCGALDNLHLTSWVKDADWRTDRNLYRITTVTEHGGAQAERIVWARRVHHASGYYAHDRGYRPEFPGEAQFTGDIIHPQHWPDNTDYTGRKFVVIGSGATAITLIPALADLGADVTMLQRTPSYVAPLPEVDVISRIWNTLIPHQKTAFRMARFNHATRDMAQYLIAQHIPWAFKLALRSMQRVFLPAEEIRRHFTPDYRPWDQRVCKAPNGDIFSAIRKGKATVVTDTIDTFTPTGIRLTSGEELEADVIVTATGLELQTYGGSTLSIDGEPLNIPEQVVYRGMMMAGLPNFSFTVGYVNASWTLRADMIARYMIRLWKGEGHEFYSPVIPTGRMNRGLLDLDAGYVRRSGDRLPKQGDGDPWEYSHNYLSELPHIEFGDITKAMAFDVEALDVVKQERTTNNVESVTTDTPFTETDTSDLPDVRHIVVDGKAIRVRVSDGPAEAGTVLMIHGVSRSLEDWDDHFALWGDTRRLIAIDVPGFGFSDPADEVSVPGTADLMWRVLDELGESRVNIIGNSLGGVLTMEMTARQPERVASTGLVASAGFGDSGTPLLRLIAIPGIGRISAASTRLPFIDRSVEHLMLRRPGTVTKRRMRVQKSLSGSPHKSETFHRLIRSMGTPFGIKEEWRTDLLERFTSAVRGHSIPGFLAWGTDDAVIPYRDFASAMERFTPKAAVVFDNCGHMPQLEYPEEFAEKYRTFLDGHAAADRSLSAQSTVKVR